MPISQATSSTAATLTSAPPRESTTVAGRPRTRERRATPRLEAMTMPITAAANTTRMAMKACQDRLLAMA